MQTSPATPPTQTSLDLKRVETVPDLLALARKMGEAEPPSSTHRLTSIVVFGLACLAAGALVMAVRLFL